MITHGRSVGIVQLIGHAIRKRKLTKPLDKAVAIGVCNYGCVKNLNDFQRLEHIESSNNYSSLEDQNLVCIPLLRNSSSRDKNDIIHKTMSIP